MDHSELIEEMPRVEMLPTQERLLLAAKRRTQQIKAWLQKEKELNKKPPKSTKSNKKGIHFSSSVVLLEAAARNDIEEVKKLLNNGVSPDACNEDGLTALHQCCIDNNEEMLLLLLNYNADVNAEDSEKWTPLHAAATCGHLNLVKLLVKHGANLLAVNADGNMPYDICEDDEVLDYIELEMAKKGITQNLIDNTRSSKEREMLNDMKILASNGESLERYDNQGATPLHIAAANGYLSVATFLLEQGVQTDVKDKDEWQPSHVAACWGHVEILEILARYGANLNAKNKNNETPADICEDPDVKERILELKMEQQLKKQTEVKKRIRRSQSNTRTQSVRRTSLRDKGLTARRDAVEEAKLRLEAKREVLENEKLVPYLRPPAFSIQTTDDNSNSTNQTGNKSQFFFTTNEQKTLNTHEGTRIFGNKDKTLNDFNHGMENAEEKIHSTDINGKVTVHVVVTINGNGTLADLKKQRMHIRNNTLDLNATNSQQGTGISEDNFNDITTDIARFSGDTTEENLEYLKPKRCCIIQ